MKIKGSGWRESKTNATESHLAKDFNRREEPSLVPSVTGRKKTKSTHDKPIIKDIDPGLKELCKRKVLSMCKKSKTNVNSPKHPTDCVNRTKPECTMSSTDSEKLNQAKPKAERIELSWPCCREDKAKPKWKKSKANKVLSSQAKDWGNEKKPKEEESEINKKDSMKALLIDLSGQQSMAPFDSIRVLFYGGGGSGPSKAHTHTLPIIMGQSEWHGP